MESPAPAGKRKGPVALTAAIAVAIAASGAVLWWRTRGEPAPAPARSAAVRAEASGGRPVLASQAYDGAAERDRLKARAPAALPSHEASARVYADAIAAGDKNPGEKAFRADAEAFFEFNGDLGEEKAAKEGITTDELKELTYMGLLAMHIRRWEEVERVTGTTLSDEARAQGDALVFSASNELKAAIRAHVKQGDSPEARWETIRKLQASFVEKYREIAKVSPEDFDRLLAVPFQSGAR